MSNGIKMADCRFYIDKEARTVICVIPHTARLVHTYINEHFRFPGVYMGLNGKLFKELIMPYSFSGKAVCAPEDEWDEEMGKMIAFSRAKDKVYKSFFKRANHFVQTVDRRLGDMITSFNDFGMKLEGKRDALEEAIENRQKNKEEV